MKKKINSKCPVCGFLKGASLADIPCGDFDGSSLYPVIKIIACVRCGHVFNKLTAREAKNLAVYYNQEYAIFLLPSLCIFQLRE